MALDLVPSRTALLPMDFQRDIIADSELAPRDAEARARFDLAVDRAREALDAARNKGVRVVHVRVAFSEGYPEANPHTPLSSFMREHGPLLEGAPGSAFDPRVAPIEGESVITKRGVSAFVGTELDRLLRVWNVDTVVFCGLVTHYVVEGSARHAADLGYRVVVLGDACASASPERHEMSLTNLRLLAVVSDVQSFA